ncbi:MAG: zinc-binding dehydrogenase [Lentisphaerae bacterium]|nr:zinc-binding dehydrogenase [Lentisphaerota bacterium]
MKTQALVFTAVNTYECQEVNIADPGADDILVRTLWTAVSPGTERWTLRGKHIGTRFPCVPGYHRIGIVEAAGANVTTHKVGDIVYGSSNNILPPVVNMFGAHIAHTVSAPQHYTILGHGEMDPALAEQIVFTVLVAVGNRGVNALAVKPRQRILHLGAGILSLSAAQIAALRGTYSALVDIDPKHVAFVQRQFPEFLTVDGNDPDLEAKLRNFAPDGFDILHDTVGVPASIDRLVQLVRYQGTILMQAQYFDAEHRAVNLDQIKIKELTIKTTCGNTSNDNAEVQHLIKRGWLRVTPYITHRFKKDQILSAYQLLDKNQEHNLGMVIDWR